MAMPDGIGIVDTMIGFPAEDFAMYDFIRKQLKDKSTEFEPVCIFTPNCDAKSVKPPKEPELALFSGSNTVATLT